MQMVRCPRPPYLPPELVVPVYRLGSTTSLLIALRDDGPRMGVDDVVWPTPFEPGVLQFIVHMPAVWLQHQLNPVWGQITVNSRGVCLGDGQHLVTSEAYPGLFQSVLHDHLVQEIRNCCSLHSICG